MINLFYLVSFLQTPLFICELSNSKFEIKNFEVVSKSNQTLTEDKKQLLVWTHIFSSPNFLCLSPFKENENGATTSVYFIYVAYSQTEPTHLPLSPFRFEYEDL